MTQYDRGAKFERRVKGYLVGLGAVVVIRSAGSRGVLDLVAFMENGDVLFVQCKLTGKISKADRDTLREMAAKVGAQAIVASVPSRGQIQMLRIDGAVTKEETE